MLVDVPAHTETTIYSGIEGDAVDFDPENALFDAHGIWFSNFDATRLWLWTASAGLQSFAVSGLPTVPKSIRSNVSFYPAGPCVPGTFTRAPA